ncbi:MAG TPA: hypothetical protein VNX28_03415 [Gemmataceae bacterium]|jgi:hypothetical protein|nr:hypothetical protein [Gemmataceae bacterium]
MPVFVSTESDEFQLVFDWLSGQRQPTPERYMRGMAFLELLWQQTIPGLSFKVVHDEPEQLPGKSTLTAMAVFAALQQNPGAQKWFVKHIRNAVVHSAAAADAIAVVGDSIHFYQVKQFSDDLGTRLFDRLTQTQKQDFAQLYAGRDARQEFATFVHSEGITHPDEDHVRGLSAQINQLVQPHSFTQLLTKAMDVERSGNCDSPSGDDWSDELNERRIELIDRDIQGNITTEDRAELAELQRKAVAYRDGVAPLPLEGARRLHGRLLEMKRQREGS